MRRCWEASSLLTCRLRSACPARSTVSTGGTNCCRRRWARARSSAASRSTSRTSKSWSPRTSNPPDRTGHGTEHSINGRYEVLQAAMGARKVFSSLKIDFPDIKVVVAPDKQSAVVNVTARGKTPEQKEFYLQELRLRIDRKS